jgi:alpha-L-rhamnosidase
MPLGFRKTSSYGDSSSSNDSLFLTDLLCEYSSNPLGVDTPTLRFSWTLNSLRRSVFQKAYQILVASNKENITKDIGDMWDSGKVDSNEQINVFYEGRDLESGKTYFWKVRCWNQFGQISPFSEVAIFHTGLLHHEDLRAKWIQSPNENNSIAPLFRKEFTLDQDVEDAYAYVSGLGYYELYINGARVGDHVLDPATTEYDKIALYATYNVTKFLNRGINVVGAILGNGFFSPLEEGLRKYGDRPRLLIQMNIRLADDTIITVVTDETWKVSDGPILYNSIWNGEVYDARLEKIGWSSPGFDASGWKDAEVVPVSDLELKSQIAPPIKVVKNIRPIKIMSPRPGVYIYDFGQNFAGWTKLTVSGPRGTKVTLRHAELLRDDGMIYTENLRSAKATDVYILKGDGLETYEPRFTYHGFRYVEVTGFPGEPKLENLLGRVVHSSVETTGNFTCSNELLNEIQENILWGQLSNLMSIPTDCPQRDERMGWMGDAHLSAEEAIYNFWMTSFYEKWVRDIMVAQADDGSVPDVVPPHWSIYPADPAWGTACVLIPWYLYQYYGDVRILEDSYPCMKRWVDFLTSNARNYVLAVSNYGDWVEPGHVTSEITPGELISTGYYYQDAKILSQVAHILGRSEDEEAYSSLANKISDAFNRAFLDESKGQYAKGSQTSNAFALYLGIVPKTYVNQVVENLIDDICRVHRGHLNTGILGTKFLSESLTDLGYGEVMYKIATQETYPGWGYWIRLGATTLWERWEPINETGGGMASYNHIMFGSIGKWFYASLAGIRADSPGYSKITIRPYPLGDLKWVRAYVRTIRGVVSSSWTRTENSFSLNVTIPPNALATVCIPKMQLENITVRESGTTIWRGESFLGNVDGISSGSDEGEYISFVVCSGSYSFELQGNLPAKSEVQYSGLKISEKIIEQNKPISISVNVINLGSGSIETEVKLYVDGDEAASKYVLLGAHESREITFTYQFATTGSHGVKVATLPTFYVNVIQPREIFVFEMLAMVVLVVALALYINNRPSVLSGSK